MASVLKQTAESMAKALRESDFIRTSPAIPVILDFDKDVFEQINKAGSNVGAMIVVKFDQTGDSIADVPGPELGDCEFTATVVEVPSVWRSRPGLTPASAQIAEAVAQILQNHRPTDKDGDEYSGSGLVYQSIKSAVDESTVQHAVTFSIELCLPNTPPSR